MKTLHLFAGAGGGLLADLILGHTPIGAVEIDPFCCQILRERVEDGWFPELRVHEIDIRLFDPSEYAGRVDCVAGGFPCQDISVAGKGAGITGERSGLWSEFARVLWVLRPRYAFIENSPVLARRGLGTVLSDLAALGYDAEWLVVSAAQIGALHKRERIWILADANRYGMEKRLWQDGQPGCGEISQSGMETDRSRKDVADAHGAGLEGRQCGGMQKHAGERLAGTGGSPSAFTGWWESEPDVGRVVNGVANRVDRIKALGNGQVPLQAAVAWHLLQQRARTLREARMNDDKLDFGLLVDRYIKIRDKKSQLQKARDAEIAKYTEALEEIERLLLAECNEMGVEALRTAAGTAYKTVKHSVTVADKDLFRDFIKSHDAWYFADIRANAPAVRAYLDENDQLPPGVNMSSWATVNVKR